MITQSSPSETVDPRLDTESKDEMSQGCAWTVADGDIALMLAATDSREEGLREVMVMREAPA